jgi:hypothetical protein
MQPGYFNLSIYQPATFFQNFQFYEGNGTATTVSGLNPLNLTGFTGVATIRSAPHIDPPLYQMTTQNGGIVLNSPTVSGSLTLYIPSSITTTFSWQGAVWDLLLTDNDGNYFTLGYTIPFLYGGVTIRGYGP